MGRRDGVWVQPRRCITHAGLRAPRGRHHDPPRDPSQPLLTRALVGRTLLVSGLLGAGTWWLIEWDLANGAALPEARIAALNLFVAVEASYLFGCRSLTHSAWRIGLVTNRWLIVVVVTQAVAQAAITYLLAMHTVFQIQKASLDVGAWLRIAGLSGVISLAVAGEKYLRARKYTPGIWTCIRFRPWPPCWRWPQSPG